MSYGTIEDSWSRGAKVCLLSVKEEGLQCVTGTSFIRAGQKGVVWLGLGYRTFIAKTREVPGESRQFITRVDALLITGRGTSLGYLSSGTQTPPSISRCPLEVELSLASLA